MKSAPNIAFDFAPSRIVVGALIVVSVLAVLAPWFSALPVLARIIASIAIIAGAAFTLRRFNERDFRRIACGAAGWTLIDTGKTEHAAILRAQARLGLCIALVFRIGPRRRFVALLLPDNCARDTRRRLLLLLTAATGATIAH